MKNDYMITVRLQRLLLLCLLFLPLHAIAQEEETAEFTSDLFGGQILAPDVMPKGRLQWEPFVFYQHDTMFGDDSYTWSPFSFVMRYGISSTTELRLQAAWLHTTDEGENYHGIGDLAVGFKTKLFDGWKAVPAISLMGNVYIPGGENYSFLPDNFGGELDLLFSNNLTSWCTLGYAGGLIWDDTPRPTIVWGAYFDFILSNRITLSVEENNYYYGADEIEKVQPWACLSFFYKVNPRMELGVSTDVSLRHSNSFVDVMVGVAWQLTKK